MDINMFLVLRVVSGVTVISLDGIKVQLCPNITLEFWITLNSSIHVNNLFLLFKIMILNGRITNGFTCFPGKT